MFKRKIFLKNADAASADDGIFNHLMFLQATDEVIYGNIPINDNDEAVALITQSVAADYQAAEDVLPDEVGLLLADPDEGGGGLMEYVPVPWREKHSPEEWAEKVIAKEASEQYMNMDEKDIKATYVEAVKAKALYGTCFFHVKKVEPDDGVKCDLVKELPELMVAAFNSEGMHFLTEEKETIHSFGYADIYRWGGSSTRFSLIIWDADTQETFEMSLHTSQAADMASLILDYINAIMATTDED